MYKVAKFLRNVASVTNKRVRKKTAKKFRGGTTENNKCSTWPLEESGFFQAHQEPHYP